MQEGQDIFGVDFDYDEFEKYEYFWSNRREFLFFLCLIKYFQTFFCRYEEESYEDESEGEDEYEEEDGERGERRPKKATKKKPSRKSIFEIYEPSELKRGHFTDLDNEVCAKFFAVIIMLLVLVNPI